MAREGTRTLAEEVAYLNGMARLLTSRGYGAYGAWHAFEAERVQAGGKAWRGLPLVFHPEKAAA